MDLLGFGATDLRDVLTYITAYSRWDFNPQSLAS